MKDLFPDKKYPHFCFFELVIAPICEENDYDV